MEYTTIKLSRNGRTGIITLNVPPRNSFSKKMLVEVYEAFKEFEADDDIRTVLMNSTGKNFSAGADADDIRNAFAGGDDTIAESFSVLGGRLVELIDNYPKGTIVAARGLCIGGSTAVFNAFDIRVVSDTFSIHDGDIYYGTVGSWGMSSLRLPIWIGRNKIMDYMFLNEDFTAQQAYELGLVSKVIPDDKLDEESMKIATKMSTAAPLAVKYFKECVRKSVYVQLEEARKFELEAAEIVNSTEDSKNGLLAVIEGKQAEFTGK
ncbi:MAG: enoyl-CoA hydratase/isomerase family protein [Solobacterium sp.]|nr:enoyl-CoA hydratase/isomerase family protein [Solobacterium sp.]MBR3127489.1 enoyl-CoA hydratase/isomerase family protein [Solobacterium sp.]